MRPVRGSVCERRRAVSTESRKAVRAGVESSRIEEKGEREGEGEKGETTHRRFLQRLTYQPVRLDHILHLHTLAVPHPRMRLRQPNHALELTRRRGDAAVVAPSVGAGIAHLDVGSDESGGGFGCEDRVDVVTREGDVGGEVFDFLLGREKSQSVRG